MVIHDESKHLQQHCGDSQKGWRGIELLSESRETNRDVDS